MVSQSYLGGCRYIALGCSHQLTIQRLLMDAFLLGNRPYCPVFWRQQLAQDCFLSLG